MARGVVISRDDEAGFPIGEMPAITEDQLHWLSHRMGLDSDEQACIVTNVDLPVVENWKTYEDFAYAYSKCVTNKREAFKYLVTQLNGKALRVINNLLDEPSVSGRVQSVQLLMRAQALLMDKQKTIELDDVTRLVEALRSTTPLVTTAKRHRALRAGRP